MDNGIDGETVWNESHTVNAGCNLYLFFENNVICEKEIFQTSNLCSF